MARSTLYCCVLLLLCLGNVFCVKPRALPITKGSASIKIVGGTDATLGQIPWQVALLTTSGWQFCGGSILSDRWILTAAHCVHETTAAEVIVGAGFVDKRLIQSDNLYTVHHMEIHEDYDNDNVLNDVALLHLHTPLVFSDNIKPIPLASPTLPNVYQGGRTAQTSGFGLLEHEGDTAATILQYVNVQLYSDSGAAQALGFNGWFQGWIGAGTAEGGKDSCNGDSGGPLVVVDNNSPVGYVQVGVVSWGFGCAFANQPGVYAKVPTYLAWISDKAPATSNADNSGSSTTSSSGSSNSVSSNSVSTTGSSSTVSSSSVVSSSSSSSSSSVSSVASSTTGSATTGSSGTVSSVSSISSSSTTGSSSPSSVSSTDSTKSSLSTGTSNTISSVDSTVSDNTGSTVDAGSSTVVSSSNDDSNPCSQTEPIQIKRNDIWVSSSSYGHPGADVADGSVSTYWSSRKERHGSFVWVEFKRTTVCSITIKWGPIGTGDYSIWVVAGDSWNMIDSVIGSPNGAHTVSVPSDISFIDSVILSISSPRQVVSVRELEVHKTDTVNDCARTRTISSDSNLLSNLLKGTTPSYSPAKNLRNSPCTATKPGKFHYGYAWPGPAASLAPLVDGDITTGWSSRAAGFIDVWLVMEKEDKGCEVEIAWGNNEPVAYGVWGTTDNYGFELGWGTVPSNSKTTYTIGGEDMNGIYIAVWAEGNVINLNEVTLSLTDRSAGGCARSHRARIHTTGDSPVTTFIRNIASHHSESEAAPATTAPDVITPVQPNKPVVTEPVTETQPEQVIPNTNNEEQVVTDEPQQGGTTGQGNGASGSNSEPTTVPEQREPQQTPDHNTRKTSSNKVAPHNWCWLWIGIAFLVPSILLSFIACYLWHKLRAVGSADAVFHRGYPGAKLAAPSPVAPPCTPLGTYQV